MQIAKELVDSKFEYAVLENGKKLATIKGRVQNPKVIWLQQYEVLDKERESDFIQKLQKRFYADCQKNKSKVLIELNDQTANAKLFMDKSDFVLQYINYVFEHNLKELKTPAIDLELIKFKDVELLDFQEVYYESSKGDPSIHLDHLTAKEFFEEDIEALGDSYDEDLMYLVRLNKETIGILALRVIIKSTTQEKKGAINFLGLINSARNKGYGKSLHLRGLQILKSLGCKKYYGGTGSQNIGMLKIFENNNCKKFEEQYCYKIEHH